MRICDRAKDLVKSGGEWISSVELENELMAHRAVARSCGDRVAHPKWSERPFAAVVLKPGTRGHRRGAARAPRARFPK